MAVYQAIARFQYFGLYHDKKRSGRPRKTSPCDDNLINSRIAVQSQPVTARKHTRHFFKAQMFIIQASC